MKPRQGLPDPLVWIGLALAFVSFGLTFRGPRQRFWQRMTRTGLALGALALTAQPNLRPRRPSPRDLARDLIVGFGSASLLYAIFQLGDRLARRVLPQGAAEIDQIYGLEKLMPAPEIAARLLTIIGPAEELFWRGFVQERLARQYGRTWGWVMGTIAYGGAHVVTGNFTLIGAATVAGAFWGLLYALGVSVSALIVSHAVWDVVIFLLAPTARHARSKA